MNDTSKPKIESRKVHAIDYGNGGQIGFDDTRDTVAWCGDNGHGIKGFEIAKVIIRLWNENAARCKEEL